MKKINLLFPIEIIARELDYKLFLAASLANKNINVIIAQQDFFNTGCFRFKGGVYIGKNVFKNEIIVRDGVPDTDLPCYNELKKNDITLLHLDEETGVINGGEERWREALAERLHPDVLKDTDYIFTWGSWQKKYYQSKSSLFPDSHVIDSGHPKYDLCKPRFRGYYKDEINGIKAKYGSFILINTNLGTANNLLSPKPFLAHTLDHNPSDSKRKAMFVRQWVHQNKILASIVALLHKLCVIFPNKTFVVRPHPGEDPEYYRTVFYGVKNIYVEKSGAVHPWIMAADLVIHDGCTTAVESFLAEIPVISYASVENKEFEFKLPNQCGVKCKTEEEVIKAINDLERDPKSFAKKNSFTTLTKSMLKNIESDTYNDFISIVNKIVADKLSKNIYSGEISILKFRFGEVIDALEQICRTLIRRFFPIKRLNYLSAIAHFPGFNKRIIESDIRSIERVLNKKVAVNYLSSRLIVVTSADDEE
jgi:surface carbohydrate biosynthesis protein